MQDFSEHPKRAIAVKQNQVMKRHIGIWQNDHACPSGWGDDAIAHLKQGLLRYQGKLLGGFIGWVMRSPTSEPRPGWMPAKCALALGLIEQLATILELIRAGLGSSKLPTRQVLTG